MAEALTEVPVAPDLRDTGRRIEALLEASGAGGPMVRERSEELVRLVVELYGAGLERLLELVDEAGGLTGHLLDRLAEDELVASLLLVSGLHPYGVEQRVGRALDSVRPYLGTHGGDVELVGISEDGTVQLRMLGSCDGCPSSAVTLELAVTEAIQAAAPEVTSIEVEEPAAVPAPTAGLISVESLRTRVQEQVHEQERAGSPGRAVVREPLDDLVDLASLADGAIRHLFVDGVPILLCRWRDALFAYRDLCPGCASDFTGGTGVGSLIRELGTGAPLATCPACARHFDVRRAGKGIEAEAGHLEPFPLLEHGGRLEIALPAAPPSAATPSAATPSAAARASVLS